MRNIGVENDEIRIEPLLANIRLTSSP